MENFQTQPLKSTICLQVLVNGMVAMFKDWDLLNRLLRLCMEHQYIITLGYKEESQTILYHKDNFTSSRKKDVGMADLLTHGIMFRRQKNILGSSYGTLQVVNDGESFLGAIINASTMIAYGGLTYEGTKETFADYYDRDVKKYLIPSNELSTILNRYFIASAIERMDDIDNALSKHLPVFVRHITEKVTLSNGEEISYGEDGLIVDMSIRKNELTILNAANFQVYTEKYYFMKSEDFIFFKLEQQ